MSDPNPTDSLASTSKKPPARAETRRGRGRVLDGATFRASLRQERGRADRRGQSFVVLGYSAREGDGSLESMAEGILRRVRATDVVGWLSPNELGVMLLRVDVEEARRLALELVAGLASPLHCVVYPHPPLPWREGNEGRSEMGDSMAEQR